MQILDTDTVFSGADTHRVAVLGFGEGTEDSQWRDAKGTGFSATNLAPMPLRLG